MFTALFLVAVDDVLCGSDLIDCNLYRLEALVWLDSNELLVYAAQKTEGTARESFLVTIDKDWTGDEVSNRT